MLEFSRTDCTAVWTLDSLNLQADIVMVRVTGMWLWQSVGFTFNVQFDIHFVPSTVYMSSFVGPVTERRGLCNKDYECLKRRFTNLVHMFQVEILLPFWQERLVTHVTLLLSLFDEVHSFIRLRFVDMRGYMSPCLADRSASLTTNQACTATYMIATPMLHQFGWWLNLQSTELALQSSLVCQWLWYRPISFQCLGDRTQEPFYTVSHIWKFSHDQHFSVAHSTTTNKQWCWCQDVEHENSSPPPQQPFSEPYGTSWIHITSGVLMAVNTEITISWDVILCSLVDRYQSACCLLLLPWRWQW